MIGGSIEDFACDLVPKILEKHWRLVITSARPEEIDDGRCFREFDVVVRGMIEGRPVTILCEAKSTVTSSEVLRFLKHAERVRALRPDEDIRALFFGYRADQKARERNLAKEHLTKLINGRTGDIQLKDECLHVQYLPYGPVVAF